MGAIDKPLAAKEKRKAKRVELEEVMKERAVNESKASSTTNEDCSSSNSTNEHD